MQAFLNKIAAYIFQNFEDEPDSVCIVLPNRRSGLFLQKHLASYFQKPIWSPDIFAIEDFIFRFSDYNPVDPITLLFELYEVYSDITKDEKQPLDTFLDWAQVLLNDFNDIDQHLADPKQIFSLLNEAYAIKVWNLGDEPTEFQKEYLRFYNSLFQFYKDLNARLSAKKLAYQGMAYRHFAENCESIAATLPWKKVVFAGFNALTGAEEKIIRHLRDAGKAVIFWDADKYYLKPKHEAGYFLSAYLNSWCKPDDFQWINDHFSDPEKNIRVTGIPKNIGQARYAGQLISTYAGQNSDHLNTAVVLADESLLLPLLSSLPENIPANVTMGYPFSLTTLYQLVKDVFLMQENAGQLLEQRPGNVRFFARDVLKVLLHPYSNITHEEEGQQGLTVSDLIEKIRSSNRVFLTAEQIKNYCSELSQATAQFLQPILAYWDNPKTSIRELINFLENLRNELNGNAINGNEDHSIDLEYLYHLARILKKASWLVDRYSIVNSVKALKKILLQLLQIYKIPFFGEPLEGIQIMGMLETRTLDFENIILLSLNESIIPAGRTANTFIPFDVKMHFKLPTYREKDAIFAYHFYRLMQQGKNIHLIYNTETDDFRSGEKSRFLTQLEYELPAYNPTVNFTHNILHLTPEKSKIDSSIIVEKSAGVMEALLNRASKGFSPTALNTYINCSLQFYFKEIARLKEAEEIEDTADASVLGSVVHDVLEELYDSFKNQFIEPEQIKKMKPKIEQLVAKFFVKHYPEGDINHGKNLLIARVAGLFVSHFLDHEIEFLNEQIKLNRPITIQDLELKLTATETVEGSNTPVKFIGYIDRIDNPGEVVRIIDYKTGFVNPGDLRLKSWDIHDPKYSKAFQLLMYAWLYLKNHSNLPGDLSAGIYSFRSLSKGFMALGLPDNVKLNHESIQEFEFVLHEIVGQILSDQIPFAQTQELDNCKYCPFRTICNR